MCITETLCPGNHVIAANEGAAVGLVIGHHVATDELPLVYLQNSGLGNLVNSLLSLASTEVFGISMLFMIGWCGGPGLEDKPQHVHQGRVMVYMLHALDIPEIILSEDSIGAEQQTKLVATQARDIKGPVALVVRKGTFGEFKGGPQAASDYPMSHEEAIISAASVLEDDAAVIEL